VSPPPLASSRYDQWRLSGSIPSICQQKPTFDAEPDTNTSLPVDAYVTLIKQAICVLLVDGMDMDFGGYHFVAARCSISAASDTL
jgi:hypothetical protein